MGKHTAVLLPVISLLICTSSLFAFDPNLPDPLAWYTFNEGSGSLAYEYMGSGNDGTIFGAEYVELSNGNYALDFTPTGTGEGNGDYVSYPDPLSSWPADWTIEVWVYTRGRGYGNPVWIMGQEGGPSGIFGGYKIQAFPGANTPYVISPVADIFGSWQHIVYVHDGSDLNKQYLYIDGVLVGENDGVEFRNNETHRDWVTGFQDLTYPSEAKAWLDGMVDEIRIYDVALPSDKVLYSYQKGSTKPTLPDPEKPDPIAWYTFNEGAGNVAFDHSGNANNGAIHGAEYVASGFNNYALDFAPTDTGEGNGDYVDFGDVPLASWLYDWTIEAWVNFRSGTYGNPVWVMGQDGTPSGVWGWYKFQAFPGANTPSLKMDEVNEFDRWYHVVYVHDGSGLNKQYLYIDGVLVDEDDGIEYRNNSNRTPWVAGYQDLNYSSEPKAWLDGLIDEIRVYDVALTEDQVVNNFEVGPAQILPPVDCVEAIARGYRMKGDVNGDCYVNIADIADMAESWLVCNDPADTVNCIMNW